MVQTWWMLFWNLLIEAYAARRDALLPDPDRRAPEGVTTPWRTFVKMDMDSLIACDFFCKNVRPHQGKENRPLTMDDAPIPIRKHEPPPIPEEIGAVERQSWLGGLLNHYERKAA